MLEQNAVRRAYDDVSEVYAAKRSENGNGRRTALPIESNPRTVGDEVPVSAAESMGEEGVRSNGPY
ncbi:hypothetical protein OB955_08035 [Halobacteria archaeon AArc-m2/3/4]|uniref:Uncharacterized protein n=1 Tax=Natronoglomus mannanivorans TaxID=2979990 RepID=A0AAP2YXL0_9EURY|nr:hypothetical protein [Halobacteria archaeon AArc-xg1-1]MCU4972687.1 hypothetical protein [Halobacteria archaeon AArc-m2/3/4]